MVQFTIAYVALGVGVLLTLAGIVALVRGSSAAMLSPAQRRMLLGGIGGMMAFLTALVLWLRSALWLG